MGGRKVVMCQFEWNECWFVIVKKEYEGTARNQCPGDNMSVIIVGLKLKRTVYLLLL